MARKSPRARPSKSAVGVGNAFARAISDRPMEFNGVRGRRAAPRRAIKGEWSPWPPRSAAPRDKERDRQTDRQSDIQTRGEREKIERKERDSRERERERMETRSKT